MDSIVTTERLVLAPHGIDDFDEMAAMWGDARVTPFLGGAAHNREDSWAQLLRYAGCWALLGYGSWCVRRRDTGEYIGSIGFLDAKRTGVAGFDGDPEIGWALAIAAQGQGFATEAVRGALGWGASRFRRTVAMIHPDNIPSEKVAAACGFAVFAEGRYKDAPTRLWEHRWPR